MWYRYVALFPAILGYRQIVRCFFMFYITVFFTPATSYDISLILLICKK